MIDQDALARVEIKRVITDSDLADMLAVLARTRVVGYDIETEGLNPRQVRVRTLQFATGVDAPVYVLDLHAFNTVGLHAVADYLSSGRSLIVAHNASFEWGFTFAQLGADIPRLYCTMVGEMVLNAGRAASFSKARGDSSLAKTVLRRYGIELDKTLQTSFMDGQPLSDAQYAYAAWDAWLMPPLYADQVAEHRAAGTLPTMQLEAKVTRVLAAMEMSGVPFNVDKRRAALLPQGARLHAVEDEITAVLSELYEEYRHEKDNEAYQAWELIQNRIDLGLDNGTLKRGTPEIQALYKERGPRPKPLPEELNTNSNRVMLTLLSRAAGVELPNLQDDTVQKHKDKHSVLALMSEASDLKKDVGTYGENLLARVESDGRIHPQFQQVLATGRTSCTSPNVQNWPPHVRECVEAPPGYTFVVADFSNLELRVLAGLSGDPTMLQAFAEGRDLHSDAASKIFGIPYDQVDKHSPERATAKTVNFGIAFGQTEYGLAYVLKRPVDECREILTAWREKAFPVAAQWLRDRATFAQVNGYSVTAGGRKRFFHTLPPKPRGYSPEWEKLRKSVVNEGMNSPIQGTAADIAKAALVAIEQGLRTTPRGDEIGLDAELINFVHDEVVIEVAEHDAHAARGLVETCMSDAGYEVFAGAPEILADATITKVWSK